MRNSENSKLDERIDLPMQNLIEQYDEYVSIYSSN